LIEHGDIGLQHAETRRWYFCIESNDQGWWYGIKCEADATVEQRQALVRRGEGIVKHLRWNNRPALWWPLWRWFDGHGDHDPLEYRDWETSTKPWIDMHSGLMARNLIALAEELRTLFESRE
jgi:hypothetical protein